MNELDDILTQMDLEFLGSGQHSISADGLIKAIGDDNYFIIDVRTDKELEYVKLPFAHHIPLADLPKRKDEIPKDKQILVYCSTIFRAAVAYTYLLANGFPKVKGMPAPIEDLISAFKPKPLMNM